MPNFDFYTPLLTFSWHFFWSDPPAYSLLTFWPVPAFFFQIKRLSRNAFHTFFVCESHIATVFILLCAKITCFSGCMDHPYIRWHQNLYFLTPPLRVSADIWMTLSHEKWTIHFMPCKSIPLAGKKTRMNTLCIQFCVRNIHTKTFLLDTFRFVD